MKKPITVTVERELGNSGDVITTIRGADGAQRKIACPGDCSPYHALASIRMQLEEALNDVVVEHLPATEAPPATEPEVTA